MKRRVLSLILTSAMTVCGIFSSAITSYAAEFVTENGTISVYNAPNNGVLTVAAYDKNNVLLGCRSYTSQDTAGTITGNYAEDFGEYINNPDATIKHFLWDMNTLKPFTLTPASASDGNKILVAYFSCTNNTAGIAMHILDSVDADKYEIVPEVPYTSADLNYTTDCRANNEQNDASARPAISGSVGNMEDYDIIFLGYPIWWSQAPKIIYTFLESYDMSGKTIVPFCTSGSSGIGSSATNLHKLCPDTVTWKAGKRFSAGASKSSVASWINELGLDIIIK